jgi:hypothetical protein
LKAEYLDADASTEELAIFLKRGQFGTSFFIAEFMLDVVMIDHIQHCKISVGVIQP